MPKNSQPPKKNSPKDVDYERLGKMLQSIFETGYMSTRRFFIFSFVKGVLTGLGGVIGATLVVGLLLWALSFFSDVPILELIVDPIQQTVDQT